MKGQAGIWNSLTRIAPLAAAWGDQRFKGWNKRSAIARCLADRLLYDRHAAILERGRRSLARGPLDIEVRIITGCFLENLRCLDDTRV